MKAMILLLGVTLAYSCTTQKEIQSDMVDVQLVKIETVQRYPDVEQKLLTWRDRNNIDYITFEPISSEYKVGTFMKVLVRK
ncbi:MAG: hypothetical protein ACTHOF_17340 [Flavisolibacter sp.]